MQELKAPDIYNKRNKIHQRIMEKKPPIPRFRNTEHTNDTSHNMNDDFYQDSKKGEIDGSFDKNGKQTKIEIENMYQKDLCAGCSVVEMWSNLPYDFYLIQMNAPESYRNWKVTINGKEHILRLGFVEDKSYNVIGNFIWDNKSGKEWFYDNQSQNMKKLPIGDKVTTSMVHYTEQGKNLKFPEIVYKLSSILKDCATCNAK